MARKKGENKSAKVREVLSANPDMPVSEVIETLAKRNIMVKASLIYFIRAKGKAKRRKAARQKAVAAVASGNGSTPAAMNPIELVKRIKLVAADVGGMKKLRELVEILV